DRICMICADDSGGDSCPAPVVCMPRSRTKLVMIATKASFRLIFIGLFPHGSELTDQYPGARPLGRDALRTTAPHRTAGRQPLTGRGSTSSPSRDRPNEVAKFRCSSWLICARGLSRCPLQNAVNSIG